MDEGATDRFACGRNFETRANTRMISRADDLATCSARHALLDTQLLPRIIDVRQDLSRRALGVALLREAFEDLDAEFFCGRALDLPELIPEPDHFALLLDCHESPPRRFTRTK